MPHKYKHPWGEIIDYVDGLDDLKKGLVRVFHDYSFMDDPTRIYRAIRFAYQYNFQIEDHTMELLIKATKHECFPLWLKKRSSRFQIELDHIKALPRADEAIEFLSRHIAHY